MADMNEKLADQVYEIARKCAGDYNYPDADILAGERRDV